MYTRRVYLIMLVYWLVIVALAFAFLHDPIFRWSAIIGLTLVLAATAAWSPSLKRARETDERQGR
jgi:hypothetical protein